MVGECYSVWDSGVGRETKRQRKSYNMCVERFIESFLGFYSLGRRFLPPPFRCRDMISKADFELKSKHVHVAKKAA